MTKEVKNVPDLRFPGFENTWEKKKFFDILKSKGEGIKRGPFGGALKKEIFKNSGFAIYEQKNAIYDNQHFRYFIDEEKYNEMIGFAVKQGDIIMSCSGTIGKLSLIPENAKIGIINQALIRFRTNNTILNTYFLIYMRSQYMQKKILESNPGSAITNLIPVKELKLLNFPLPNINEQKKLGSFFCKLDRQIELEEQKLEKLKEQKKGYMQNIFAQKLHFKDENGNKYPDWTVKTLNEVFEVSKKRNKNNEYSHKDVLSVSREHGVINQIKYHGRSYAAKTVENYKIVKPHDLIYTKSPLKGAPYGIFKVTTEEGIISPLYAVYTSLNENITDFVSYYFEFNNITTHYLSKLVSKGAKNTINVTDEMALTGKVILPNSEKEVTQIVNFFNKIRELIKKQRKKIEGLKMRKQGFLQKMFV